MNLTKSNVEFNRRALLGAGGASALAALTPFQAAASGSDTEVAVIRHCEGIRDALFASLPDGAHLRTFAFTGFGVDGGLKYDSISATAVLSDYALAHARPAVFDGWRAIRNAGGAV